jgi:hypothetical protein
VSRLSPNRVNSRPHRAAQRHPAVVGHDHLAGDVRRLIAGQERATTQAISSGRPTHPERSPLRHLPAQRRIRLAELKEVLGADGPGRHRVHPDAVLATAIAIDLVSAAMAPLDAE